MIKDLEKLSINEIEDLIKEALKFMPMIISIIVNCKGEYSATVSLNQAGVFTFQELVKLDANTKINDKL